MSTPGLHAHLEASTDSFRRTCEESIRETGGIVPMAVVIGRRLPNGRPAPGPRGVVHVLIPPPPGEFREQKDRFYATIRACAERTEALQVMFASEAWMVPGQDWRQAWDPEAGLSEHPDRIEIAMVRVEREDGRAQTHLARIVRGPGGAHLEPWETVEEDGAEGSAAGLLPPRAMT